MTDETVAEMRPISADHDHEITSETPIAIPTDGALDAPEPEAPAIDLPPEVKSAIRELVRVELVKFSGALIGTEPTGDSGHMFRHFLGDMAKTLAEHLSPPIIDLAPPPPAEETAPAP